MGSSWEPGLLIVNPPFTLPEKIERLLPFLAQTSRVALARRAAPSGLQESTSLRREHRYSRCLKLCRVLVCISIFRDIYLCFLALEFRPQNRTRACTDLVLMLGSYARCPPHPRAQHISITMGFLRPTSSAPRAGGG